MKQSCSIKYYSTHPHITISPMPSQIKVTNKKLIHYVIITREKTSLRGISNKHSLPSTKFYKREHKNFDLEKFVAGHLETHRLLNEANYNNGADMDNVTEIQHLKSRIKLLRHRWKMILPDRTSRESAHESVVRTG